VDDPFQREALKSNDTPKARTPLPGWVLRRIFRVIGTLCGGGLADAKIHAHERDRNNGNARGT
jgi:hypothetical protein